MLESALYGDNTFVTLTYDDEKLPEDGSLNPYHLRDFLKRFRKAIAPHRVRFYAVGEYGDVSSRPHYHLALFNFPSCVRGSTLHLRDRPCCWQCDLVRDAWQSECTGGRVSLDELSDATSSYVAGYVVKKMTRPDDPRLEGRFPEFCRMSNRPGIGADLMDDLASTILENPNADDLEDVPTSLRHGSRCMPLGKYLRRRLRVRIGMDEKAPQITLDRAEEKLRPLRLLASAYAPSGHKSFAFKQEIINAGEGQRQRLLSMVRNKSNRKKNL